MTRTDRRRLLQQLEFSQSRHFSWDNFPANTMAYDKEALRCMSSSLVEWRQVWEGRSQGGFQSATELVIVPLFPQWTMRWLLLGDCTSWGGVSVGDFGDGLRGVVI